MKLNFTSVLERFEGLGTGGKAEVKRASSPEELKLSTVLYQLGFPFKEYWQREKKKLFFRLNQVTLGL